MAVTKLEISSRSVAGGGESFGDYGQYEFIRGVMHFAVDPDDADSRLITDIALAPKGADGKVHFSSDVQIVKPLNARPGGSLLVDFVNRGNRSGMAFNSPRQAAVTGDPDLGNGFLMRHGFTVAFCGWQWDVPEGRIGLHAPEALDSSGNRIEGLAHQQYTTATTAYEFPLSDASSPGHQTLPAARLDDANAVLLERDWPDGPATEISRSAWQFARWIDGQPVPGTGFLCMPAGFQPGKVYELIYTTVGAYVIGLGFLAMRDFTGFLRYATEAEGNPCAGSIGYAFACGTSQSGRTLREFLYLGLNTDESGRPLFDGAQPHTASSRLGEFNLRFGQPSSNHMRNVGNAIALPYTEETDPVTGRSDGLLRRLNAKGAAPKIVATNSAVEYWWTGASLVHIDAAGKEDLPLPENVRVYSIAGAKHGPGSLPLSEMLGGGLRQQHYSNTLDYRPMQRAALLNLETWVRDGVAPPPSLMPSIADGTAVRRETLADAFRAIPGMGFIKALPVRRRLDYGEGMALGVPDYPPTEGEAYATLVSSVDADGNEVAGVRLPDVAVPLGTYMGWTIRHPEDPSAGHLVPLQGAVVPFPRTRREREERGDPRPSLEERYGNKDGYLDQVRAAAESLAKERYLLDEDIEGAVKGAAARWDAFSEVQPLTPVK